MGTIKKSEDKFEIWDGGHCYVRAIIEKPSGRISLLRWPRFISPKEVKAFGDWAATLPDSK